MRLRAILWAVAAVAPSFFCATARANEHGICAALGLKLPWACHDCDGCPDDYCKKPLPVAPCKNCAKECDAYCKKPFPRILCLIPSCLPDCYPKKPLPPCPRACEPWYKCGRECVEPPRFPAIEGDD